MNTDKNYLPLEINKLRPNEVINFNIYIKSQVPGDKGKYVLFCRGGEIFSPGIWGRIELMTSNGNNWVYYRKIDDDLVRKYLSGLFFGLERREITPSFDRNNLQRSFEPKRRLIRGSSIPKESYFHLAVKNLKPGIEVNFDVFLKKNVIDKDDFHCTIFIRKGDICRLASIDELHQKGINKIYFHRNDEDKVFRYLYHNLSLRLKYDELPCVKKAELIYDAALIWTRRLYFERDFRTPDELKIGFKLIELLLSIFYQDRHYYRWLSGLCRHDGKLYVHSLNTCIIGMGFTKYLDWPNDKIIEFGQGTLLHDIGMVEVPPDVLNKPGRLTEAEMRLIKKHPTNSHRILKDLTFPNINYMLMVLQHHELGDGSGYPKGIKLPLINHWARILRIIDSYEAMTSRRSWRLEFDSLKALKVMRQEWLDNGIFDINYLIEFIKFLSGK